MLRGKAKLFLYSMASLFATLILALTFSFAFTSLSDTDPVDSALRRSDPYFEYDRNSYLDRYQRMANDLGYDLPSFYYQIVPSSLGSTALFSLPVKERQFYLYWASFYASTEEFTCFFNYIGDLLKLYHGNLQEETLWSIRENKELSKKISIMLAGQNNEIFNCYPSEKRLAKWNLRWQGSDNRFHRLLASIVGVHPLQSNQYRISVWELIGRYSAYTLLLSFLGIFWVVALSYWLSQAIVLGKKKGYKIILYFFDWVYAMPVFWLSTLTVIIATKLLVSTGLSTWGLPGVFQVRSDRSIWEEIYLNFSSLFWPLLVIVINGMAYFVNYMIRLYREEGNKLYVQALISKGWNQKDLYKKIISKRVLYSLASLLPLVLASMISGSVVLEVIFNIPGMGFLLWISLKNADWAVVHVVVLLTALLLWLGTHISRLLQNKWSIGDGQEA